MSWSLPKLKKNKRNFQKRPIIFQGFYAKDYRIKKSIGYNKDNFGYAMPKSYNCTDLSDRHDQRKFEYYKIWNLTLEVYSQRNKRTKTYKYLSPRSFLHSYLSEFHKQRPWLTRTLPAKADPKQYGGRPENDSAQIWRQLSDPIKLTFSLTYFAYFKREF